MKALLLHCKNYQIEIGLLANRPSTVQPEPVTEIEQSETNCVVALITVEVGDKPEVADSIEKDIRKMAQDTGRNKIAILPFAHLSNNLADSSLSIAYLAKIEENLADDFHVKRAHFGSHKEFLLDVFGHPGNARFREY